MIEPATECLRGKRLVVFGAGYVGGEVVRRALQSGAEVLALTRNRVRAAELAEGGADVVVADLADRSAWEHRLPAAPDFIVNTVSSGGGGIEGYRRSYVQGAQAILAWGQRGAVSSAPLVYTSSTSVYPQGGGALVEESAAVDGGDERAALLRESERLAWAWPGGATVLRLAGIYGPGRHYLLDALRRGDAVLPGSGDHRLNLIHRDDAVSAIVAALARPALARDQTFNVADDGAASKAEVVSWLAAQLRRSPPSFDSSTTSSRRAVTPDRIICNGKLKTVLAWTPRYPTFREGYADLLHEG